MQLQPTATADASLDLEAGFAEAMTGLCAGCSDAPLALLSCMHPFHDMKPPYTWSG